MKRILAAAVLVAVAAVAHAGQMCDGLGMIASGSAQMRDNGVSRYTAKQVEKDANDKAGGIPFVLELAYGITDVVYNDPDMTADQAEAAARAACFKRFGDN